MREKIDLSQGQYLSDLSPVIIDRALRPDSIMERGFGKRRRKSADAQLRSRGNTPNNSMNSGGDEWKPDHQPRCRGRGRFSITS
jgi:hypothetical protein